MKHLLGALKPSIGSAKTTRHPCPALMCLSLASRIVKIALSPVDQA
jgi:hypothetical protein